MGKLSRLCLRQHQSVSPAASGRLRWVGDYNPRSGVICTPLFLALIIHSIKTSPLKVPTFGGVAVITATALKRVRSWSPIGRTQSCVGPQR